MFLKTERLASGVAVHAGITTNWHKLMTRMSHYSFVFDSSMTVFFHEKAEPAVSCLPHTPSAISHISASYTCLARRMPSSSRLRATTTETNSILDVVTTTAALVEAAIIVGLARLPVLVAAVEGRPAPVLWKETATSPAPAALGAAMVLPGLVAYVLGCVAEDLVRRAGTRWTAEAVGWILPIAVAAIVGGGSGVSFSV